MPNDNLKVDRLSQRIVLPSEREIISLLAQAVDYEFMRQVDKGFECLRPVWSSMEAEPIISGYSKPVQAEILLRCGAWLSYHGVYKAVHEDQERARGWLTESVRLFNEAQISDKVVEAESELAITYFREKRNDKALSLLQEASFKVKNDLHAVNIKNISYQLTIYFSEEYQAGEKSKALQGKALQGKALMKEKDVLVRLSQDSRIKAMYYNTSALLMSRLGEMSEALIRFQQCVHFCKEVDNKFTHAIAENNIAFLYRHFKEFDLSLEHWRIANDLFRDLGLKVREAESYDTLALILLERQIFLRSSDFSEPLKAINKAIEMLQPMGFVQGIAISKTLATETSSLIVCLQTKARILLYQGKTAEALVVFTTIYQIALTNLGEKSAFNFAKEFSNLIDFNPGIMFDEEVMRFESKLLEAALVDASNVIPLAAASLGLTEKRFSDLLNNRHTKLRDRFEIEVAGGKQSKNLQIVSAANYEPVETILEVSKENLASYECNNFPAFIPESVDVTVFMQINENRLESVGLIEGRIAVVSNLDQDNNLPTAVREFLNSKYHYGYRIDSCGLIGLDSDKPEIHSPLVFMPEQIEVIGSIVGYLNFNVAEEIYEYYPLPKN